MTSAFEREVARAKKYVQGLDEASPIVGARLVVLEFVVAFDAWERAETRSEKARALRELRAARRAKGMPEVER